MTTTRSTSFAPTAAGYADRQGFKDEFALSLGSPQPYGEICVMRPDGSDVRVLTDNTWEEGAASWVPLRNR